MGQVVGTSSTVPYVAEVSRTFIAAQTNLVLFYLRQSGDDILSMVKYDTVNPSSDHAAV